VRGAPAVELEAFVDDPADPLVALNGRFLQRPVASFGERVTAWSWKKCLRIIMLKHPGIKMSFCPAAFSGSGEPMKRSDLSWAEPTPSSRETIWRTVEIPPRIPIL
jgi:hypothetical protein